MIKITLDGIFFKGKTKIIKNKPVPKRSTLIPISEAENYEYFAFFNIQDDQTFESTGGNYAANSYTFYDI